MQRGQRYVLKYLGYCGYYGYSEKIKIINRLVDSDFSIIVVTTWVTNGIHRY
jgi:hypothetical protein